MVALGVKELVLFETEGHEVVGTSGHPRSFIDVGGSESEFAPAVTDPSGCSNGEVFSVPSYHTSTDDIPPLSQLQGHQGSDSGGSSPYVAVTPSVSNSIQEVAWVVLVGGGSDFFVQPPVPLHGWHLPPQG